MYLIVSMNEFLMYMYSLNHGIIFKLTSNYGKLNCIVLVLLKINYFGFL